MPLYDANGKPWKASHPPNAMRELMDAGVDVQDDGGLRVSPEAMKRIRQERLRRAAVSTVPSTPRQVERDGGGVGVRKGHGKFELLSLEALRSIRERAPILQAIHSARQYQIRRMCRRWSGRRGDVGWRVVHKDHHEIDSEPPESIQPFIRRAERLLEVPSEEHCPTMGTAMALLEEDFLTINRPVVEVIHSLINPRRVVGFRPVDGAIIWPTLLWVERWKANNHGWSAGYDAEELSAEDELYILSEKLEFDLVGAEYCLVREGILEATYRPGKLLVAPLRNRTDVRTAGYWPSHVEQAVEIILSFINAWDYNANFFTRGMMAEFLLGISGDVHDADITAFVDMLREATQGVRRAWQPPILPLPEEGVLQKIDLKPNNRDMMFEVWMSVLGSLGTAVYRMDTSTIGFKPWDGGGGPKLNEPSREAEISLAKEEGLQGDIEHLTDNVFNPLIRRCHPDLRLVWEYGDFDPQREAEINAKRAAVSITRNEVRLLDGLTPMGFWVEPDKYDDLSDEDKEKFDSNLWNMPADPSFVSAINQRAMMGGMGGEEEAEDDGFGQPPQDFPYGQPDHGPGGPPGPPGPPGGPPGPPPGMGPPQPEEPMQKGRAIRVYIHPTK